MKSLILALLIFASSNSIGIFEGEALASANTRPLSSVAAVDLSASILRDNYDIWAGEMMNQIMLESTKELLQAEAKIQDLTTREKFLSEEIRNRLRGLLSSSRLDEASVQVALLLSRFAEVSERLGYLRQAEQIAQKVAPGSSQTLRVSVLLLAELLAQGNMSDASRVAVRVSDLLKLANLGSGADVCLAELLVGDVDFQKSDFSAAERRYSTGFDCLQRNKKVERSSVSVAVMLRRIWTSFRLMRYAESLTRLEELRGLSDLDPEKLSPAVREDISVILGISLSEVAAAEPPSNWVRSAGQSLWVADGLVRVIKYLVQKEQYDFASRWSEQLEPYLSGQPSTVEFYSLALAAFESARPFDAQIDLRYRAVSALHPHGRYARSLSLSAAEDAVRRARLVEWARISISQYAQQDPRQIGRQSLNNLFRVAETLVSDSLNVCGEMTSLTLVHRILASSESEVQAERVYGWLKDCAEYPAVQQSVSLNRIDMFRASLMRAGANDEAWKAYFGVVREALEKLSDAAEIRRAALAGVSDGLERSKFSDAESLFLLLISTFNPQSENAHLEMDGLVDSGARLFSGSNISSPLEVAGWSLLGFLQRASSADNVRRRLFETALADWIYRDSWQRVKKGRVHDAFLWLKQNADKFSSDSAFANDLNFEAVRLACLNALDRDCISAADSFLARSNLTADDRFHARHWQAGAFERSGRLLRAAENWMGLSGDALDSQRIELLRIAKSQIIKAGNVFAELRMWQNVLLARSILVNLTARSKELAGVHESVLRWSLLAADAQANDVLASLSSGLSGLWVESSPLPMKGNRKVKPASQVVGRLVQSIASGKSMVNLEAELISVIERLSQKKLVVYWMDERDRVLVDRFLSRSLRRWQSDVLLESEKLSRTTEVAQIEAAGDRLSRRYAEMLRGCRAFEAYRVFRNGSLRGCDSGFVSQYRLFLDRLENSLARAEGSEIRDARRAAETLSRFSSKLLSTVFIERASVNNADNKFEQVFERRRNVFSSLDSPSANGGVQ